MVGQSPWTAADAQSAFASAKTVRVILVLLFQIFPSRVLQ
jgi:hypothetical protein